jgi:UDP-N-acetyl-D-mannosaminuronic acid transferase (WecB/TagA/CpsF family)
VNIIIPCGGMIDVFAGKVKLASPFLKKIGLATLIRVIQEPRRQLWLNILIAYETFFKIIPKTLYEVKIKKNKNFKIPSIYGIKD